MTKTDHFIVDFYCAALKLVIEVDGDNHFTEDRQQYDWEQTQILTGYGLTVIRFTNTGNVCLRTLNGLL